MGAKISKAIMRGAKLRKANRVVKPTRAGGAILSKFRKRPGESNFKRLGRLFGNKANLSAQTARKAPIGGGAMEAVMNQVGMGKSASKGKRAGAGTLGRRMFDKLRQRGRQMTPGQAKAEAMADQAAGRPGRRPPSLGKRGRSTMGRRGGGVEDRMRRRASLGKRGDMMARRRSRPPGIGKRGGMRMQRGGFGGIARRFAGGMRRPGMG